MLGNSPSRNGAANATTETISRLLNEGISLRHSLVTAIVNVAVNAAPGAT
jgi:hypothetical protein